MGRTRRPLLCYNKKNGDILVTPAFVFYKTTIYFPLQIKMCCEETGWIVSAL